MSESCVRIKIEREVPFFGSKNSLESRLRRVGLRGFKDVKIYENADFELKRLGADEVADFLHTPQPHVYADKLARVSSLAKLFFEKGIDIFHLDKAYDFVAYDKDGVATEWTMLPPIVEVFEIPERDGSYDYAPLIGERLEKMLGKAGLGVNSGIAEVAYNLESGKVNLINDGSHRVHGGVESGRGVTVLCVSGMAEGFPYYAVPQSYSEVRIVGERDQKSAETKIHVVDAPAHKDLYRLFPSGGIMSGDVRPDERLEKK